ncbi:MAG: radical SAM protein [Actinomycetota bacterium]
MKVMIAYPPIEDGKGIPLLTQNRQFQWFNKPTYIYPVVPATAATLLKSKGYDVVWADGIAEGLTYSRFVDMVRQENPDIIAIETKTPVVKKHWRIVDEFKALATDDWKPNVVLLGDHVTALPRESMENCRVDFVLTGGDYDFSLLNLADHLSRGSALEPGVWYRRNSDIDNTGKFELKHDLNDEPTIDRDLTKWRLYAYKNGNFRKRPGAYVMAGRDCWWGKCTFCSWTTIFPKYRVRKPENVLDEIGELIGKYGVREIMDDTGTFPAGQWLETFCQGMIDRGYNKKVTMNCNMRAGALKKKHYDMMAKAGFRMLLYGLEAADQTVLNRVNKGTTTEEIAEACRMAKQAGLQPHITTMVGYPWETKESATKTIDFARDLFAKGWVDSLQSSIIIPYPGTPLFDECKKNGWLVTEDWDRYDMTESVIKSALSNEDIKDLTKGLYKSFLTPRFIIKKLLAIRSFQDIKFLGRAGLSVISRLREFSRGTS